MSETTPLGRFVWFRPDDLGSARGSSFLFGVGGLGNGSLGGSRQALHDVGQRRDSLGGHYGVAGGG